MNIEQARVDLAELDDKRKALEAECNELRTVSADETRDLADREAASSSFDQRWVELEKVDADYDKLKGEIQVEEKRDARLKPSLTQNRAVEVISHDKAAARVKNPDSEEKTYRPDNFRQANFWKDLIDVRSGNVDARARLDYNVRQAVEWYEKERGSDYGSELRDMTTSSTAGGDFMPPLYLADLWVHPNMAGRPLADALPKYPLPPTGVAITIPKLSSGVTVAARAAGGTVSETDGVTATVSHDVNEYAGLVDIDRIAVMRSDPGLQDVITRTLVRRYNVAVDTDLISGSGTAPHHKGLDNVVTGTNSITWTQASPTPALLLSQILNGISQIDTNRIEAEANLVVFHGRRMAWGSQPTSSTFSLFQQGQLFHSSGTQDGGFISTVAGIEALRDNNITTTAGASTNEDRVYILAREDFLFAEGPLYAKVEEGVGSGTGAIRFSVFGHSAFLSNRYPASVSRIAGTGLAAGTFSS